MRLDVNSFLGSYPFRRVPGTSPDALLRAMDRVAIDQAWVTHLPGIFWRDPAAGNPWLYETTGRHDRLRPVPAVHPGLAGWEAGAERGEICRCPGGSLRSDLLRPRPGRLRDARSRSGVCAAEGLPLMLAVRLEDARQRHPNDRAGELPPWAVRTLVRSDPRLRLIVTHADRAFVEEVHFGSTPEESARIWWDICWIWGPPEDHLETLLRTVGMERFVFGTGQPLRLPENQRGEARSAGPDAGAARGHRVRERAQNRLSPPLRRSG